LSILTQQKEEQTKITITYKKIDPNVPIKFPFKIPKGYDKIELD